MQGKSGLGVGFVEPDDGRVDCFAVEDFAETGLSELKNPKDVAFDKPLVDQLTAGQERKGDCVADSIDYERPPVSLFKDVFVVPERVRPLDLFIHESERWFPRADEGSPADW